MLVLVTQDGDYPTSPPESGDESGDDLLPPGTPISEQYVVGDVIGSGGMATVYVGYHRGLDRKVAIKVMHPWLEQYPELNERFLREARTQATLSSPNVATVHDLGLYAGSRAFIVSELVQGHDLRTLLVLHGALPLQPAVNLVWQTAMGLTEAHAAGIVHRDIKPENLMLCGGTTVKIIDFGIAKIQAPTQASRTRAGDGPMGSPGYMAPEQFESPGSEDARTDVWAMGVVLFELLTGQAAFDGETMPEICCKVITGCRARPSELRPEIPEELEAIVTRCLSLDPDDRFADAAELAAALRDYSLAADAKQRAGRRSTPPQRSAAQRFNARRWAVSALIGLAALVASSVVDPDSLRASAARLVELSGAHP